MGHILVRSGKREDIPSILNLIKELAAYEKEPNAVVISEEVLMNDAFGTGSAFEFIVTEHDGIVVGTAIFYYCYSTWRGKYIYLEDLIVTKQHRRLGIGGKLFEALIKRTRVEGLRQFGWQVLDWNNLAIDFYKKYNATLDESWVNGRLYFNP
jgi:GNAT superfamily N-acetyltransferase